MKVYMTNGTLPFLMKLAEKHKQISFHFMRSDSSTLAYYEGIKKRIFAAGREFEAINSTGDIAENGFVMMDHIPIPSDTQPVFENSFHEIRQTIVTAIGFQALRLLKPRRGNTYIILTQWNHKSSYEEWAETTPDILVKPPAYFADKRFRVGYQMVEKEE